jgi:cyclic pyranopterin phosphate synthase
VSVTDRCDLRCIYCMAEEMDFVPKSDVLSLEELQRLSEAFVRLGVRKIRLTGGEPLTRRNVMSLIGNLGQLVTAGALDELTLTTNGTLLARHAEGLAKAGVRRINVSLDSLDPATFRAITRRGDLARVLEGVAAAKEAGLAVKINTVALKGVNENELDTLVAWCGDQGFDLCLIETMPLGDAVGDRTRHYLPLPVVRERLVKRWTLIDSDHRTGGPARYVTVAETGQRLGFITPLTHQFCQDCNRLRVTCTGDFATCLGRVEATDLKTALRASEGDERLEAAIRQAVAGKPKGHDFIIDGTKRPILARTMNVTGG